MIEDVVDHVIKLLYRHSEILIATGEKLGCGAADDMAIINSVIYHGVANIATDKPPRLRVVNAHKGEKIGVGAFGYNELEQSSIYSTILGSSPDRFLNIAYY